MTDYKYILMKYIKNIDDKSMSILNGSAEIIGRAEGWNYLNEFEPNKNEGFMWSNDKIINQLMNEINKTYDLDNGVVFVMRNLKLISSEVIKSQSQSQCE